MTAPVTANPFVEFVKTYQDNVVGFVREVIGKTPYQDQIELLEAYQSGQRRIAKRSGHGVGKSAVLSWIATHQLFCRFPQKTVITSASASQLWDALAAEVKAVLKSLPPKLQECIIIQSEAIYLAVAPDESFVSFRVSKAETPEAMAGVHSPGWVLLIADEASGIPDTVFEAASGSMSGHNCTTLLAGNPVRTTGYFFDTFHKMRGWWWTQHVSCVGHPNVSTDYVESQKARYGEDSNAYRIRVLGEFPTGDDDTVIPFQLVESSLRRDVQPLHVKPIWGVDCARFGNDASAICKRRGNSLVEKTQIRKGYDVMQVAGWVKSQWDEASDRDRPSEILVDSIGIGAGVCDRLMELGLPTRGINVSESAAMTEQYINLRAELWFKGASWFARKDSNLANDEELAAELVQPRFKYASNGKRQVESKDDMKKRGVPSPNRADAFLLTLASESVTASGNSTRQSWNEPLKFKLAGIV
jgi:phage terminase large subunit